MIPSRQDTEVGGSQYMGYRTSADGETTANMTNLAIKGIVGVKAMAEISRALGQDSDANTYDVRT